MTYRIIRFLSVIFLLCGASVSRAQEAAQPIHALAGPAGNYLYLVLSPYSRTPDTAKLSATDYYLIERATYDSRKIPPTQVKNCYK